ncbi:MAG: histone deacetylase [Hyphomicrobiales bacterium]
MLPIVHHPSYHATIPTKHRFPMNKFQRLQEILQEDGIATDANTFKPDPAPHAWLTLAHSADYVDAVLNGTVPDKIARDIGFPMNPSVALRGQCATGGSVLTARLALEYGLAANTAGGSHHARYEQGAGFCVFNDVAVAVKVMQQEALATRILIVDLDVHQGDGTAQIFAGDPSVFTLSFHGRKNYPHEKAVSDLDIALTDAMGDERYLQKLDEVLPRLLDRGKPDLVFYNAGVDSHEGDKLGRLALSEDGLFQRDHFVLSECRARNIPVACVLGGGYLDDIDTLARRHSIIHRVGTNIAAR